MKIKLDQRQCGAGKTTTTLYQQINLYIALSQPTLIVVPSIKLQEQYQQQYPDLIVLNNKTKSESSVNNAIIESMKSRALLICITHQAFLLLQDIQQKADYNLIIDESLDNLYSKISVPTYHDNRLVTFDWEKHFELEANTEFEHHLANPDMSGPKPRYNNTAFTEIMLQQYSEDDISQNSSLYQQITNANMQWHISPDDYHILQTGREPYFMLFGIVKEHVMQGWKNILIAAAAFDHTKMGYWLAMHALPTSTKTLCYFEAHDTPVTIHHGDMQVWSLSKQQQQASCPDSYEQQIDHYIQSNTKQEPYIALRNKNKGKGKPNEHLVEHNVHGLNQPKLAACQHIVIQSALNPDKQLDAFLRSRLLAHLPDENKDQAIIHMHAANLFYQVIMRSALRNGQSCDIYVMDKRIALALQRYFANADLVAIPLTKPRLIQDQSTAKQAAKQKQWQDDLAAILALQAQRALSPKERAKLYRARKNLAVTDCTTDQNVTVFIYKDLKIKFVTKSTGDNHLVSVAKSDHDLISDQANNPKKTQDVYVGMQANEKLDAA